MTYHLFDGVDPFASPSGPFQVSLCRGPVSSPSRSARPGDGQAHRELGIALRRAPKETENGCLQAQPSYATSFPQHLVLVDWGFTTLVLCRTHSVYTSSVREVCVEQIGSTPQNLFFKKSDLCQNYFEENICLKVYAWGFNLWR